MSEPTREHDEFAVPVSFYVETGIFQEHGVVVLDLVVRMPMAPEIGEQRAVLAFLPEDAVAIATALTQLAETLSVDTEQEEN